MIMLFLVLLSTLASAMPSQHTDRPRRPRTPIPTVQLETQRDVTPRLLVETMPNIHGRNIRVATYRIYRINPERSAFVSFVIDSDLSDDEDGGISDPRVNIGSDEDGHQANFALVSYTIGTHSSGLISTLPTTHPYEPQAEILRLEDIVNLDGPEEREDQDREIPLMVHSLSSFQYRSSNSLLDDDTLGLDYLFRDSGSGYH
jgi:hypothetical protein